METAAAAKGTVLSALQPVEDVATGRDSEDQQYRDYRHAIARGDEEEEDGNHVGEGVKAEEADGGITAAPGQAQAHQREGADEAKRKGEALVP